MRIFVFLILLGSTLCSSAQSHPTLFEQTGGRQSPTYPEIIRWWQALDKSSAKVRMEEAGPTDAGHPLHLVLVSSDGTFRRTGADGVRKSVIFINNGIHPGEPDGIDASMLLVRDIVTGKYNLPSSVLLVLIPVYNIGGALNRSPNYRVDQDGPEEKGFRGNSQNLDLNRDFIKADSREALSFTQAFRKWDPEVFVDNHVSNGADYQHVMTLLTTQHNKLGGPMGAYLHDTMEPDLYRRMKGKGFDLVPYVNHSNETPDKGWTAFWDGPRYSSGYAALWHSFAFVPETHMLKPYPQRVASTRALMESFIEFTAANGKVLQALRKEQQAALLQQPQLPIRWKLDRSGVDTISFHGYAPAYQKSTITGQPRLYYDRSRPLNLRVPFYNTYRDSVSVAKPAAYILPQGWWKVAERLRANGIRMQPLTRDTVIPVQYYRIEKYTAIPRPYEGHHLNTGVDVSVHEAQVSFRKGDFWIPLAQPGVRFLMEVLEPHAEDSYFAWNFFDGILGQKEGFSDYVFEESAAEMLRSNPTLKARLEERKRTDSAFAQNGGAQLDFLFKNSPYYESAHLRYPVYRVVR